MFRRIAYTDTKSILPQYLLKPSFQREVLRSSFLLNASAITLLALIAAVSGAGRLEASSSAAFQAPAGIIGLEDALTAAMENSPVIARYHSLSNVRNAELAQSELRPNPEIEFEIEEFGGTGDASGIDSAETTALFTQLIELGSKRKKRSRVAGLNEKLALWDYETARVAVLSNATIAFVDLLAEQEKLKILKDNLRLVRELRDAADKRVEYGEASPLELSKVEAILTAEGIKLNRSKRDLENYRIELASVWGGRSAEFKRARGTLDVSDNVPEMKALYAKAANSPGMLRWVDEVSRREEQIRLERSNAVPDLKFGAGVKHFNENGDVAGVVQFSFPLPLFDRNQGNIRKSRHELEAARSHRRESELRTYTELTKRYNKLSGIREEYAAVSEKLLPVSKRVYESALTAYESGEAGYLEVIDAHRMHAESKLQLLQVLRAYNQAIIEIESLTAVPDEMPFSASETFLNDKKKGNKP